MPDSSAPHRPQQANSTHRPHWVIVLSRWAVVFAYAIIGGFVWFIIAPWAHARLDPLATRLAEGGQLAVLGFAVGIAFTSFMFFGQNRFQGWLGLRHCLAFPPAWFASVLAIPAIQAISPVHEAYWVTFLVALLVLSASLALSLVLALRVRVLPRRNKQESPTPPAAPQSTLPQDFDGILQWIATDDEIASPEQDRFDHQPIARRIVRRLREPTIPTIALIGPRGSGKSSVRALVKHELRNNHTIRLVHISLWPFDSPEAAVRGILRALIKEVTTHAPAAPLAGLSEDYVLAIERSAGSYGALFRLLRGSSDPESTLKKLSDIATAIGIKIVLWVEDLERFGHAADLADNEAPRADDERLGPVRALLYLLDQNRAISVVIADTTLNTRFDLDKIARFVERMPTLPEEDVWNIIDTIRRKCLAGYPMPFIDPASAAHRNRLGSITKPELGHWLILSDNRDNPAPCIVRIVQTPRILKSAMRVQLEAWGVLEGEIDFDTMLAASVLRVACPEVFVALANHADRILWNPTYGELDEVKVILRNAMRRSSQEMQANIRSLLDFIVPGFWSGAAKERSPDPNPQSLFAQRTPDNWRRYLNLDRGSQEDSDQFALKMIQDWSNRSSIALAHAFTANDGYSYRILTLCRLMPISDLKRLADSCVQHACAQADGSYLESNPSAVCNSVYDIVELCDSVGHDVLSMLLEMIEFALPRRLLVAFTLCSSISDGKLKLSAEKKRSLSDHLTRRVIENFASGESLPRLLMAGVAFDHDAFLWLLITIDRTANSPNSSYLDGMRAIASNLTSIMETSPEFTVPQFVKFFTENDESMPSLLEPRDDAKEGQNIRYNFRSKSGASLFDRSRLRPVLSTLSVPLTNGPELRARLDAAIRWAKEPASPA